jgi:hypothetical protein
MSLEISINLHIEDGYMSDMSDMSDSENSKKLEINFKCGIESSIIFFVSELDKKTFKKLLKILKNTYMFDDEDENIIFLLQDGSALYNRLTNEFIFRFDNSKNHSIIYNPVEKYISFCLEDGQYCKLCDCVDCEYYSKFSPSSNIKIPFTKDTKNIILQLFVDIIKIIDKNY